MFSGVAVAPSHRGRMESLRWPNEARNCSRVSSTPSLAMASRQAIQWSSSEAIRVPSISQRTARLLLTYTSNCTRLPDLFGYLREGILLQVTRIAIELANAFGEFFGRHRVFVVHPAEGCLGDVDAFVFACRGFGRIKLALQRAFGLLQLHEQFRADGQQITSRQADDLIHVAETRSHHLRFVAIFFVVVVDALNRRNSGVLVWGDFFASTFFFVPVINTANERRDQGHSRFGASDCLGEA